MATPGAIQRRIGIPYSEDSATTTGPSTHFGLTEMAHRRELWDALTAKMMKKAKSNYNSLAAHKGLTERARPPIKLGIRKGPDWQYGPQGYLAPTQRQPSQIRKAPGTSF
jgi:hypothetical protein